MAQGSPVISVCRPLSESTGLVITVEYGSRQISGTDAELIAKELDDMAAAVIDKHQSNS
jgi:hypothetical protein